MIPHWDEAKRLLDTLAYIVKDSDPNGIDLYFTITPGKETKKHTTDLLQVTEKRRPPHISSRVTNIYSRLGFILGDYEEKLRGAAKSGSSIPFFKKSVRPMNLYVFTDGLWQPSSDAETPIKSLVDTLEKLKSPMAQVGIQFIRFGNDSEELHARLERLDSGLGLERYVPPERFPLPFANVLF